MKRTFLVLIALLLLFMTIGRVKSRPVELESINEVDFNLEKLNLEEQDGTGIVELNAIIKNNGNETATTGSYVAIWEKVDYHLPLEGGKGILNESVVELDLNGDGDETDSFNVSRFINATRQWDAVVNDSIHAYAISEGPPEAPDSIMRVYIDGKVKFFQLGNKKHCLYRADGEKADFGLDAHLEHQPSPNFNLWVEFSNSSYIDHLNIENFKINGDPVEANYTQRKWRLIIPPPIWDTDNYVYQIIISKQGLEISAGENVTFTCTLKATNTTYIDGVFLNIHWFDGEKRLRWEYWDQGIVGYLINVTSTPTTSSTSTRIIPGVSFIPTVLLILPVVFLRSNKRCS